MLNLSIAGRDPAKDDDTETIALLAEIHRQLSDLLHTMPNRTTPEVTRLGLVGALRQILQDEMQGLFDEVLVANSAGSRGRIKSHSIRCLGGALFCLT